MTPAQSDEEVNRQLQANMILLSSCLLRRKIEENPVSENFLKVLGMVQRVTAVSKQEYVRELERQIDVLMSTYSGQHCTVYTLSPSIPHLMECLSALLNLLENQNIPLTTTLKTLTLLHTFALSGSLCKQLTSQLKALPMLVSILQKGRDGDELTKEGLRLVQRLTYGLKVSCPNGYVEDVLKLAIKFIQCGESMGEIYIFSLQILANLCRANVSVQAFMKGLPSVVHVQRQLVSNLSKSNLTAMILSLQILGSLYLDEEWGEKIFGTNNIEQTFQLGFSVLCSSDGDPSTRKHAADLLIDISSNHRIQQALRQFCSLRRSLERTIELIPMADGDTVAKVLEMCVSFSQIPEVRTCLVKLMLKSNHTVIEKEIPRSNTVACENTRSPFLSVLNWACKSADMHSAATVAALDFLKEVFEGALDAGLTSSCREYVEMMLPMLVSLLEPPSYSGNVEMINTSLKKVCKALSVLSVLYSAKFCVDLLSQHVHLELLNKLIQDQLRNNPIASGCTDSSNSWSETGVSVLMMVFALALEDKRHSQPFLDIVQQHLQDCRLYPVLAYVLHHSKRQHILVALQLIGEATRSAKFQIVSLADAVVTLNDQRTLPTTSLPHIASTTPLTINQSARLRQAAANPLKAVVSSATVDSLIEKFKSGFEVNDLKSSAIIEIYERKLEAMASKESHMQDLVDAKALALAQADRLIHQYQRGKVESDAECVKLCSLYQDAEKRCEGFKEELKTLQAENSRLLQVAEKYHQLTQTFQEQMAHLKSVQEALQDKQQELEKLDALHIACVHQNEIFKTQIDDFSLQMAQMEEEIKRAEKQRHATETTNQGLQQTIEQGHERIHSLEKTKGHLEERLTKLSNDVKLLQQQISTLQHEKLSLAEESKALKQQMKLLEDKLSTTEAENAHLQEEVNVFSAVKNLINRSDSKI